jgi:hypothetical protein
VHDYPIKLERHSQTALRAQSFVLVYENIGSGESSGVETFGTSNSPIWNESRVELRKLGMMVQAHNKEFNEKLVIWACR